MKISIQGNSGCHLEVVKKKDDLLIKKVAVDADYAVRLKRQAQKQQHFYTSNPFSFIQVPRVIREDDTDVYSFEMTYYPSLDFISYFQQAEKSEIDQFIENITEYFAFAINNSTNQSIASTVIQKKYKEIKARSSKNSFIKQRKALFTSLDEVFAHLPSELKLPTGNCHGDLTFSNILFNKRKKDLVLIDFLDSFIETPLQDMVKLRQDTKYFWSFHFYNKEFDKTKMSIVFDYIDNRLHTAFKKYHFYKKYYSLFQIVNMARILPYAKSNAIADYLDFTIRSIILEHKITV